MYYTLKFLYFYSTSLNEGHIMSISRTTDTTWNALNQHFKKNWIIVTISLVFLTLLSCRYRYFIPATLHEYLLSSKLRLPEDGNFVVRAESSYLGNDPQKIPMFIKHTIQMAFPEYNIVYSNAYRPNLIIKDVYRARHISMRSELQNPAPYLSFSPEKGKMKARRYRSTGYPLHEFVTYHNHNPNLTYVPFAAYSKNHPSFLNSKPRQKIPLNVISQRRDLAFVYSHCVPFRDAFFRTVSKYLTSADSYGKCLNNQASRAPGSFNDLTQLYRGYKFVAAIEHTKKQGYLTEKIINAYEANSIPVYWGASETASELFNTESYIDLSKFSSHIAAASHLQNLARDPKRLQTMLAQPVLTEQGEIVLSVNKNDLPEKSRAYLAEAASQIREKYFRKVKK